MHNLDRTQLEGEFEDEFEFEDDMDDAEFEFEGEDEFEDETDDDEFELESEQEAGQTAPLFDESDEMELAAELLNVNSDEELEQFLGRALRRGFRKLKRRTRGLRRRIRRRLGRGLRRGLRFVARRGLRNLGRAAGGFVGGPVGAAIGGRLASRAGRSFGLELEGLSPEDQEFEVARRIVRITGEAAQDAVAMPETVSDEEAASMAVRRSVGRLAPALLRGSRSRGGAPSRHGRGRSGKWMRRGSRIIVMGV